MSNVNEFNTGYYYAPYIPHVIYFNKYHHSYTETDSDGYGVCRCGARENTDASVKMCPLSGEHPRKENRNDGKNYEMGS